jgi:hypothetical protein
MSLACEGSIVVWISLMELTVKELIKRCIHCSGHPLLIPSVDLSRSGRSCPAIFDTLG